MVSYLSFFLSPNLVFVSYIFCVCVYVCCGHDDDFIRDRYILIRSVETRTSISIRTIFVFVTSVLSSRATANASVKMLHKIYAAYLHLWRNGRDVCYIPRATFRKDKSYE